MSSTRPLPYCPRPSIPLRNGADPSGKCFPPPGLLMDPRVSSRIAVFFARVIRRHTIIRLDDPRKDAMSSCTASCRQSPHPIQAKPCSAKSPDQARRQNAAPDANPPGKSSIKPVLSRIRGRAGKTAPRRRAAPFRGFQTAPSGRNQSPRRAAVRSLEKSFIFRPNCRFWPFF